MKYDLAQHPYFESLTDKQTGITSHVLTKRVAEIQQGFYFVNSSVSADGEWLWFNCAFPPSPGKSLGVVSLNPQNPVIFHFPETQFSHESPLLAPEGNAVYFCQGPCIYKKTIGEKPVVVCTVDAADIAQRCFYGLATHLTMSADGKSLLVDMEIGNTWSIGVADIANGKIELLHEFPRKYNHAQFSPHDPDLFMMAEDWFYDRVSGRHVPFDHRTWLMNVAQTRFELINPKDWVRHNSYGSHEWWSKQGNILWVDYDKGVFEYNLKTEQTTHIWKRTLCHAHCDAAARYFCADESPYRWDKEDCAVKFFDRATGRDIDIAVLPKPAYERRAYHLDPHPHFSTAGDCIIYTTTARGMIDVAITDAQMLVSLLS